MFFHQNLPSVQMLVSILDIFFFYWCILYFLNLKLGCILLPGSFARTLNEFFVVVEQNLSRSDPFFRCRFPERDLKLLQLLRVQCAWITRSYEVLSEHIVPNVQTGRQDEEPAVVSKVVGLRRFQTLFTIQQEPGLKHTDPLNR